MEQNKQKIAVFDIDGTIFRSNLHFELFESRRIWNLPINRTPKKSRESLDDWINRRGKYRDFEKSLILSYQNRLKRKSGRRYRKS